MTKDEAQSRASRDGWTFYEAANFVKSFFLPTYTPYFFLVPGSPDNRASTALIPLSKP